MAKKTKYTKEVIYDYDTGKGILRQTEHTITTQESKAVIYCRVSDKQQVSDGHGLESQERYCEHRCNSQSVPIHVVKIFKEPGVS